MNARTTDYDTSKDAAAFAQSARAGSIKSALLDAYAAAPYGLTDEAAAQAAGLGSGAWKRCSDLRREGAIIPMEIDGEIVTRPASTGRMQIVCVIA